MQVQLVMFKSDGSRRDFPLTRDRIIIGRTNEVGLRIPLSSVSRKHCEIAIEGNVLRLRDLGSSNGTLHNNVRVKEAELSAGDRIEVGPVVFIVVIDGQPAEVEKVCSLLEQDLVDTSVGMPAVNSDDEACEANVPAKVMEAGPVAPQPTKSAKPAAPAPIFATAPTDGASDDDADDEVLAELEEPGDLLAPSKPSVAASARSFAPPVQAQAVDEEDALAAAANAAEKSASKPKKPGESFSGGATELDHEDPIAALERLAAAERAQEEEFSMLTQDIIKSPKTKKK